MADTLFDRLAERFPEVSKRDSLDYPAFDVPADALIDAAMFLRDAEDLTMLVDATAIDWGMDEEPRFTGIYHLYKPGSDEYVRLAADATDEEPPVLPSLSSVFPAANWHERETYDMFGIRYSGHPELKRILMWEGYEFYPLRREFPLAGMETDLPADDVREATGTKVLPAPMMGGPFHAPQRDHMSTREPRADDESWTELREKKTFTLESGED